MKEAARILYEEIRELKVFHFFYPGTREAIREVRETPAVHAAYFHACELETSYMLYLAEEFVDMARAIRDVPAFPEEADLTPTPWEEITETAVLGDATLATKEKGKRVIDAAVDKMAEILRRSRSGWLREWMMEIMVTSGRNAVRAECSFPFRHRSASPSDSQPRGWKHAGGLFSKGP